MNKKVGVSILFGFLLLVGFFGLSKFATSAVDASNTAVTMYGELLDNATKIRGGAITETMNITVVVSDTDGSINYSNITLSFLGTTSNLSFTGMFINGTNEEGETLADENASANESVIYTNTANTADWQCINVSSSSITCANMSVSAALGGNGSSLTIRVNVTSATGSFEGVELLNVSLAYAAENFNTSTTVPIYVDGLGPQLISLNVSDGNVTWLNDTETGNAYEVRSGSTLTVNAAIRDMSIDANSVYLIFSNNGTNVTDDIITHTWNKMTEDRAAGYDESGVYRFSYALNTTPAAEDLANFVVVLNDTYNQESFINGTQARVPFNFYQNDTLVEIVSVNITSAKGGVTQTVTDPQNNNQYVADNNVTLDIRVKGSYIGHLTLYFNETGGDTGSILIDAANGNVQNTDWSLVLDDATFAATNSNITNATGATDVSIYQISIDLTGNDSNKPVVALVINSTNSYNDGETQTNGGLNNYSAFAIYNFQVDGQTATPTIADPTSKSVNIKDTTGIEFTCNSVEGSSGVKEYEWKLTRPKDTLTFTNDVNTKKITFKGSDIDQAGTYTVKCRVTDNVGNDATSSASTFTVNYETSTTTGGGSGGGGGAAATVSFDVDFSTTTTANVKAQQGIIRTFSFDGSTKHTITFNEVSSTSATVTIASTPVKVTLNVGQTKEVDVNGDKVNDMSVKLKSVVNGLADVEMAKIEAGAMKVVEEEKKASGVASGEGAKPTTTRETAPEPVKRSNVGLWITLLVIVVVVVVGYLSYRKK